MIPAPNQTTYRLVRLGEGTTGIALVEGEPHAIADGLSVSLLDRTGNLMIEVAAATRGVLTVKVDGAPVYEVAHVKAMQCIAVNGMSYVVMAPYGVYLRDPATTLPENVEAPTEKLAALPVSRRRRLAIAAVATLVVVFGAAAFLVPDEPQAAVATAPQQIPEPAPAPTPAPTVASVEAPETLEPTVVEAPAKPVKTPQKTPMKPAKVATVDKQPPPAPVKTHKSAALPPEQEARLRSQLETYQLEGGFDPEAAIRKLKALKASAPADAAIQAEIDKAIKNVVR